jgi:hypothetical protein
LDEILAPNILAGNIVGGWMAGFKHPPGRAGISQDDAAEFDANPFVNRFESRGTRIVPDRFLAGAGLDAFWSHHLIVP